MEYFFYAVLILYAIGLLYLAGDSLIKCYFREKQIRWYALLKSGCDTPPEEYEKENQER